MKPSSPASTPELSRGIDQAVEILEGILESGSSNPDSIQQTLGALMGQLRNLNALPVVTLDAEQSSEMVNIAALVDLTVESMRKAARLRVLISSPREQKISRSFEASPKK